MTISASSIIRRATDVLMDSTSVRWPASELVRWLNDAQREVILLRADAMNRTATGALAVGARQSLDAMALNPAPTKLIEITRNLAATSNKNAVRLVARHILDAQIPGWYSIAPTINILHYMFDARDPKTFYVYPPAAAGAQLEIMYSGIPNDIAEPADGSTFANVVGNIGVPDIYANTLLDYVLYRAYSKDSEYAGNEARAASHYAMFNSSLSNEIKVTLAVAPQMKPGMPTTAGV